MNRLIAVIFGLAFAVCANADLSSNRVERISKLEKCVAVPENECRTEREKTSEEIAEEKAGEEKRLRKGKEIDAKIDAFLKEYFGIQFGDSFCSLTNRGSIITVKHRLGAQTMPTTKVHIKQVKKYGQLKKYSVFDDAICLFMNGKLYCVWMVAKFDKKYSTSLLDRHVDISLSELCEKFSLPKNSYRNVGDKFVFNKGLNVDGDYSIREIYTNMYVWSDTTFSDCKMYAFCITSKYMRMKFENEKSVQHPVSK